MATRGEVRRICAALPGAIEGEGRFGFGVEVKGKVRGFCWTWMERVHPKRPKVENPGVLAVVVPGLGAKDVLMASEPEMYASDPHYDGFPAVLVRLDRIGPDRLSELLIDAWRCKVPVGEANPRPRRSLKRGMEPNETPERGPLSPNADPNAGPGTTEVDASFPDGDAPPDPED